MGRLGVGLGPATGGGGALSRLRARVDPDRLPREAGPGLDVAVEGPEARRLIRVMRVRPGEPIQLFDGRGRACDGRVQAVQGGRLVVRLTAPPVSDPDGPESSLRIVLVQAVAKAGRMELALEKATELGVAEIWPVIARRCVARPGAGGERTRRWQRVVETAARQAGRWVVPEVRPPVSWEEALGAFDRAGGPWLRLLAWESAQRPLTRWLEGRPRQQLAGAVVAVGPEGGWTEEEVEAAVARGFEAVSLGPRILRTETAGWLAIALLQAWWRDLDRPAAGAGPGGDGIGGRFVRPPGRSTQRSDVAGP